MGRKHRFLDIWGDKLFRSAYSYLPQSTIGDFLNESMRIFYDKYGDDIDIIMQLHDAIYVQCKPDAVSETMEKLTECMVRPIIIGFEEFIIGVDFKVGKRWGDVYGEDIIELEEEVE
jgi:DNA polymerase I-like protein with 3'-5' exonuclease and polymerase domains